MKKTAIALACLATLATFAPQTASAQRMHDRDRYVERYCDRNPGDRDCHDWRYNRHSWNEDRYHSWYGRHRHEFGPEDAAAAIFGFAAGAITGTIGGDTHRGRCEARYRSYDWRTDMFRGYDGDWHQCRL